MLSPHVTNQSLKTFRLKFRCEPSDSDFYAWIEAAKRRRIEELQLESKYFYSTLNPTFLISQTLVVLKLESRISPALSQASDSLHDKVEYQLIQGLGLPNFDS
ncbi:F-box/FBD/LRR-repeat protein [Trifolium repens]|nr:F-box/FBD/LRR-repeat protein [Trifolium repens]